MHDFSNIGLVYPRFPNAVIPVSGDENGLTFGLDWTTFTTPSSSFSQGSVGVRLDFTTSDQASLKECNSCFINNFDSVWDVYLFFPDTGQIIPCRARSWVTSPVYTNGNFCILYTDGDIGEYGSLPIQTFPNVNPFTQVLLSQKEYQPGSHKDLPEWLSTSNSLYNANAGRSVWFPQRRKLRSAQCVSDSITAFQVTLNSVGFFIISYGPNVFSDLYDKVFYLNSVYAVLSNLGATAGSVVGTFAVRGNPSPPAYREDISGFACSVPVQGAVPVINIQNVNIPYGPATGGVHPIQFGINCTTNTAAMLLSGHFSWTIGDLEDN